MEGFHFYLNRIIEINHPRQALFVDKIKNITYTNYLKYIKNCTSINKEIKNSEDIFKDAHKYFKKYLKKYKKNSY